MNLRQIINSFIIFRTKKGNLFGFHKNNRYKSHETEFMYNITIIFKENTGYYPKHLKKHYNKIVYF